MTFDDLQLSRWIEAAERLHWSTPGRYRYVAEQAALALAQPAPQGWRMVPVEPTAGMIDAGYMHTLRADEDEDDYYRARGCAIAAYSDMIAAAPTLPLAGDGPLQGEGK